jgi:hypothetical protein
MISPLQTCPKVVPTSTQDLEAFGRIPDCRTGGPLDGRTRTAGREDRRTTGHADHRTGGPQDGRTRTGGPGPLDGRIARREDRRTGGWWDRSTENGRMELGGR